MSHGSGWRMIACLNAQQQALKLPMMSPLHLWASHMLCDTQRLHIDSAQCVKIEPLNCVFGEGSC